MLFFSLNSDNYAWCSKSEELINYKKKNQSGYPMTAPICSPNWPAFCDEICWICSYFVWNCSPRIRKVMNKNILKSQNIGEGIIVVYMTDKICVGHIVKGVPLGFWLTGGWLFLRNTYNAGFSFFLLLSLVCNDSWILSLLIKNCDVNIMA